MPSNTAQLLESDDTEPDLPVPVQNLSGLSLRDDESPSELHDTSHLGVLGAVLDLQPLSQTGSEEENTTTSNNSNIIRHDADLDQLRARALTAVEAPGTGGLFQDGPGESQGYQVQGRMMMAMMRMQEGERCALNTRRKSVNTTECVLVATSEHVAEIVGRQGCKIKALRAKTNTYIKTPVRGEEPVFVVTGRKEDVIMVKREILSAAEHFSLIRASRNKVAPTNSIPCHPGQTTIQVRVPYRMVGLVVGPKGATIKRIQQQTHTYIVTPSRDKEPVFEVTGMPENVDRAREEIEAHIAMRTAGSVDTSMDDDDFHYNGTDVGFELGGNRAWLFSGGVSNFHSNAAGYRNDSSSSLGSNSSESYYSGKGSGVADLSPGSSGGTFWFGDSQLPLGSEDPAGYDGLTMTAPSTNPQPTLWGVFERGGASLPTTPRLSPSRLSPSLPEDHPLVRLVQENSQSLPAFDSTFSPSSDSTGSSSPPDVRTYSKHSQAPACVRCGDNMAALVLGGQNLVCLECSNSILQSV
ncbi:RNA-binding E3 ubiquitin-protein ligase MEX3C-like [Sinocyclocheilus grahami]|uniref:Mex-3 RNA binding family member C n=1 Tax=Sinocyclocheilus grahami TaxID=75366 RepID=A0A672KG53_SINGR|nr:PREDICTED: RNA-binding E3 ubiquitin-protein ligase MEX3C-like [Sinocyclocheilus grahami]XP_016096542.1 PREDICTED: RNA-binding E3 ubiquitin-protein ligase MEX3C-like [Sinocyclocheilus grahami]